MAGHAVDEEPARQTIADAARRAGQDELQVALAPVRPFMGQRGSSH
jgi:hypothetical protein